LVANIIVINYDVPRTVAIVGPEGAMTSIRLSAQHFYDPAGPDGPAPMRFSMMVNAGAAKPTSRAARIAEAVQLYEMHCVDQTYVLQAFQVAHSEAIVSRMAAAAKQAAIEAALTGGPKGQPKGPGTGHEH
jgi:hypothetical protein